MMTLFNSLVRPLLEYCPEVWNPYKMKNISAVEQIQRTFTSKIRGIKHLNYWERLAELNILSLQRRRERLILITVWKIKNGTFPNNINFNFKTHTRTGAVKAVLQPMPRVTGLLLTKFEQSFIIKAASYGTYYHHI